MKVQVNRSKETMSFSLPLSLRRSWIECNEIAIFSKDVSCYFDHILMTSRCLECFKGNLRCITLNIISIDHNLYHTIPDLRIKTDRSFSFSTILLLPKRNLQQYESISTWYLNTICNPLHTSHLKWRFSTPRTKTILKNLNWVDIYHFFSNGIISCFEIGQHFLDNIFRIGSIAHGIEKIDGSLANTHITFTLKSNQSFLNDTTHCLLTFKALMTVSWCFFTASWENSDAANRHILSKAK